MENVIVFLFQNWGAKMWQKWVYKYAVNLCKYAFDVYILQLRSMAHDCDATIFIFIAIQLFEVLSMAAIQFSEMLNMAAVQFSGVLSICLLSMAVKLSCWHVTSPYSCINYLQYTIHNIFKISYPWMLISLKLHIKYYYMVINISFSVAYISWCVC